MATWFKRWGAEVAPTKFPGVWRLKSGGFLVRARATTPTSQQVEIRKRLPDATSDAEASKWLEQEREKVRTGGATLQTRKQSFAKFAKSLFDEKVAAREIRSARGIEKWKYTLIHLITAFGDLPMDRVNVARIDAWRVTVAGLITAGSYKPSTVNGWTGILKVITKAARRKLKIEDAAEDLRFFDTSEHPTYTDEEPNALTDDEARRFLEVMRDEYPQHYAMAYLGFATGLRPSHLRPLRRSGAEPDVLWKTHELLIRRSHTLQTTMDRTKNKRRQKLGLTPDVMEVLQWHIDTQLLTPEQFDSELLFPAEDGRPRSESCLRKPFLESAKLAKIRKRITPKGMRRTFNDLARGEGDPLVLRSITGHATEGMRDHYSTVTPSEQRTLMARLTSKLRGGDTDGDESGPSGDKKRSER